MYLVGLTGGIGSGKSEAARMFAALGVPVVDTDAIARDLTAPGSAALERITRHFGDSLLRPDRTLDRAALRERVFADDAARKELEAILHPLIHAAALKALERHPDAPYQLIVVPLLFESPRYLALVDRTLLVDCAESLQISRAAARSQLSPDAVRAIMRAQLPRAERARRADDIIHNDGSLDELQSQVERLHRQYLQACIVRQ